MTKCSTHPIEFPRSARRRVEVDFEGGTVTSDGGALLLRECDSRLDLTRRAALAVGDNRQSGKVVHSTRSMMGQLVYALALGYEDLNDHDLLRDDPCLQTAVGRDSQLAASSTLCRFQNRMDREATAVLNELLVDLFVESFESPPEELVLNFDATDVPIHGEQAGRFFHGYYRSYSLLPLYVTCGHHLLVSYLRSSKKDQARHAWAILSLLVRRIRQETPLRPRPSYTPRKRWRCGRLGRPAERRLSRRSPERSRTGPSSGLPDQKANRRTDPGAPQARHPDPHRRPAAHPSHQADRRPRAGPLGHLQKTRRESQDGARARSGGKEVVVT